MIVGHGIGSIFTSMFTVGLATEVTSGEGEFIIWDDDSFLYLDTGKTVITNVEVSPIITDTSLNIDDDADLTFVSHYIDGNQITADEDVVVPAIELSETSLACWIPFNGDPNDDSANAHDFSPQNSPSYITGPGGIGQAIEFNSASNEYATIADHPDFDCTGAFSLGAWLRSNDLSVDTGFFQKLAGATGCLIFWEMPAAHWRFRANLSNSTNPADTSADWVADDSWQHFVFTRADATADIKVYKNAGTPVVLPTGGATVTANTNTADLGRYFANPGEMDIAEFFLFNRELTSDEVATIYNSGDRLSYADITWT